MEENNNKQSKSKIQDYEPIVGRSYIEELRMLGDNLNNKVIQNINSTYVGGGVAEILDHLVPLVNQLGVDMRWDVIHGNNEFFTITKKIHNAIHGVQENITSDDFDLFMETTRQNARTLKLYGDIIFVHDPQPIALVDQKERIGRKWAWRCHIDASSPDETVWNFLHRFIIHYDAAVFSAPNFARQLTIPQFLISPSIDPLSDKNKELSAEIIHSVLSRYKLNQDKPMILQVSRFDRLKDPVGVIATFEMVRKNIDCQLVLAGGTATDDPESEEVLKEVQDRASGNPDIHVLLIPPGSDIEINALQRAATVILQKSIKEGFGLTVSEALWKKKPVVATGVGGITLQVKHKFTGLLCHSIEGAAYSLRQLLTNKEYANWLGQNGHQHVKQNFLITRHVKDYLLLFLSLYYPDDVIYL